MLIIKTKHSLQSFGVIPFIRLQNHSFQPALHTNTSVLFQLYSLEQVLAQIRRWHEAVRSPQSTFYLFVLLSLMGFGTSIRPGMHA